MLTGICEIQSIIVKQQCSTHKVNSSSITYMYFVPLAESLELVPILVFDFLICVMFASLQHLNLPLHSEYHHWLPVHPMTVCALSHHCYPRLLVSIPALRHQALAAALHSAVCWQ
eukprot:scpid102858/ scgid24739/ 